MNKQKNYWLYVLQLEDNKYYVGITSKTPEIRMQQHVDGILGAKWTKKYRPINLFDKKELGPLTLNDAEQYENKVVRRYMKKYGYNNVRGGDLSYSDKLIKRIGWYIPAKGWEVITVIAFLLLIILVLFFKLYTQANP